SAHKFAEGRKITHGEKTMNRLYVIESGMTITGAMADHRFPMRSSEIIETVRALANKTTQPSWVPMLLEDVESHRGRSIVIAGETQPPEVHALVHLMNDRLGNVGKTVFYTDPVE